jgi:MFS family permease
MASTILLLGVMADWLGKELMFVIGAVIFMATAFLILLVGDFTWLLLLRCVQGFGAAMISGTAVAILANLFPKETGLVIGINTTAVYVGTTLGPVLGGFLVNYVGWPSLFIFSGAIALVSAMLTFLSLDFTKRSGKRRPHFETLLIFTFSTILVSVGSAYIRSLFGLAALFVGLAMFVSTLCVEHRKSLNLVEQIFEKSTFLAYLVALLNYVATYALTILYSNYLQLEAGFTSWEAGLILLAQPIPQMLLSPLAGYLSDKWDPGALAAAGMGLITLGIGVSIMSYKWLSFLIASLILLGTGFAFFASPNTTQIMRKIPREAFASASSFLGLMRFLGQSLSTSILTATMLAFKTPIPMEESLTVYLIIAVVGAATAVMSAHRKKA